MCSLIVLSSPKAGPIMFSPCATAACVLYSVLERGNHMLLPHVSRWCTHMSLPRFVTHPLYFILWAFMGSKCSFQPASFFYFRLNSSLWPNRLFVRLRLLSVTINLSAFRPDGGEGRALATAHQHIQEAKNSKALPPTASLEVLDRLEKRRKKKETSSEVVWTVKQRAQFGGSHP